MARTLQQARSRAARYDGRTGSGSTENTKGEKATTEVSTNNGTMREGAARKPLPDGIEGHMDAENGQGDEAEEGTATTGREGQTAARRHTSGESDRHQDNINGMRGGSDRGTQRTTEVDESFYTARDTTRADVAWGAGESSGHKDGKRMEDSGLPGYGAYVREQVEGFCEVCAGGGEPRGGSGEPYDT